MERTGLSYIPLYSHRRKKPTDGSPSSDLPASSSHSENAFSTTTSTSTLHVPGQSQSVSTLPSKTSLSKFLPKFTPCYKLPIKNQKSAGTIYTGWKYRKEQEEKEQRKKEELAEKQRKQVAREAKRRKKRGMCMCCTYLYISIWICTLCAPYTVLYVQ